MWLRAAAHIAVLVIVAEMVSALLNTTADALNDDLIASTTVKVQNNQTISNKTGKVWHGFKTGRRSDTRRQGKKGRSTSSSSGDKDKDEDSDKDGDKKESLGLSSEGTGGSNSKEKGHNKYVPKSSRERRGWRKWHRKCPPCGDLTQKWREPGVNWVCGGYQRARRSFKSTCMMHYRNCQDGTMFVKIHGGRCRPQSPDDPRKRGDDFFYDYKVVISGDSSGSSDASSSQGSSSESAN